MSISHNKIGRRSFLKMAALSKVALDLAQEIKAADVTEKPLRRDEKPVSKLKTLKSVYTACSVGCGVIAEVQDGVWVRQEEKLKITQLVEGIAVKVLTWLIWLDHLLD